jgi:hypothetical protein
MRQKITVKYLEGNEAASLVLKKHIEADENGRIKITESGYEIINTLEKYYSSSKRKSDKKVMGNEFESMITKYRELFPKKKLPSGKLARNNVKTLTDNFKWFFSTYDYTWEEIIKATERYIKEYREKDWQYMKTSQYFISKQDKHKVKVSELADYCDMIRDGIQISDDHFKERVV